VVAVGEEDVGDPVDVAVGVVVEAARLVAGDGFELVAVGQVAVSAQAPAAKKGSVTKENTIANESRLSPTPFLEYPIPRDSAD
jgi:hypothetical protein